MSEIPSPKKVNEVALKILRSDPLDNSYAPIGAIGLAIDLGNEGPDGSGDREPRKPLSPSSAGAVALKAVNHE
jgi:hypothetical protein